MKYLKMMSLLLLSVVLVNCKEDPAPAPIADFTFDVDAGTVTFNGLADNATSYAWEFGDGETSMEEDPIHIYAAPGTYDVIFTATGEGGTDSETKKVEAFASVEFLLSGGAGNTTGKSWILDRKFNDGNDGNDGSGGVTNNLTIDIPITDDNVLDEFLLSNGYNDVLTFHADGKYVVDNSADLGGAIMSALYAEKHYTMIPFPDGDLLQLSNDLSLMPLADIVYTPKTDASWSINRKDFAIDAVDPAAGTLYRETFSGHTQLVVDEYFGIKDAAATVIIKSITETKMNVAIVFYGSLDPVLGSHMFHLTFVAK